MKHRQQSMEEQINIRIILVGFWSLVLTAVLSMTVFYQAFDRQVKQDLSAQTAMLTAAYNSYISAPEQLAVFADQDLRITLISPEGQVLYDSSAPLALENHQGRPEVQSAAATGQGSAQRKSDTLGHSTYYHALLAEDGCILRAAREVAGASALFQAALPALALFCLLLMLVSVVASLLLTRKLVRPVLKLGEDLDHLPRQMPYRELEPLGDALRADLLARANSEKLRQEFTANVSHELKTPLTSISGYAELLESGMAKPEDLPLFAGRIRTEASRMQALVGDILQLSALENTPEGEAAFQPVDLQALASRCTESLRLTAQKHFVTLRLEGGPALTRGVPHLLEELCLNLCDNALRYNRPGGLVTVTTGLTPENQPFLTVEDNGIGIPEESQSRVFERFYRVDKSRSKATGGTGLGLAIVKHIALLHGASIRLKSRPEEGTRITLVFAPGGETPR